MKTLVHGDASPQRERNAKISPLRVCMHVRGTLRTDARVRREASTLVQEGFVVTVVDVEYARVAACTEDLDGIHVKHLVKPHWSVPTRLPWRLVKSAEKFFSSTLAVLKVQADIYHAHDLNAFPACYLVAMLRRKPLIFDAHEMPLYELDRTRWRSLRALLRRLLSSMLVRCAGTITVSQPIAQEMCERYHVANVSVIRNIPNYRKVTKNNRLQHYLGADPAVQIALYQGNLQEDRGLDHVIRAARFLAPNIVIVLMGKAIGNAQAKLEALIANEKVTERVRIMSAVPYEELLEWTASADLGLIIYKPDLSINIQMCLPNKLFEYLMAGLPVLATPLEAVADLLNTHQAGQIVSSLEPERVAEAINTMLTNRALLEEMHDNALRAVEQHLCWEEERSRLLQLYQRVLIKD